MFFRTFCLLLLMTVPAAAQEDHSPHMMTMPGAGYSAETDHDKLKKGAEYRGGITLRDSMHKLVKPDDLEETQGSKIHMMLLDAAHQDYQHVHPVYAHGAYTFAFTPQTGGDYHFWLDITPKGGAQQFVTGVLKGVEKCVEPCADKTVADTAEFDGNKAVVTFDKPLTAGQASKGTITLTNAKNKKIRNLEPVMGAFAHIAAFYEDNQMEHIHPGGRQPKSESELGSSPLTFAITPAKAGFLKYFIQIRIKGEEIFLPMGAEVN